MVKSIRLFAVGLALVLLAPAFAFAGEPRKCDSPEECQRRAKAAFAFAKAKSETHAVAVAPMPHAAPVCVCGGICECASGLCPKCDPPAVPVTPPVAAPVIVGYQRVCDGRGGCYWVPIYGP